MRIDAHQHFWYYDPQRDAWITDAMAVLRRDFVPSELVREMSAAGIDASIAVQADQSEAETRFLLSLAAASPEIAGVVGWIDLRAPDIAERLQHWSRYERLRGFRHIAQAELDDRFLVQPEFVRGVRALAEHGFTYDILIYPRQLPAAIELAQKAPEQRFVLDHIAKPPIASGEMSAWREGIRKLAQNLNVFCKLSGLVTEAEWRGWRASDFRPYLDVVLEAFGPERLMFGSDWPVCLLAASYKQVVQLVTDFVRAAAPEAEAKIFGENALRFYSVKAAAWTCS